MRRAARIATLFVPSLVAWAVVLLGFGLWVFGKLDRRLAEEL